ncbi:insulin-like peptide 2 isoform X2 [Hydra vulgaris]|uniref:Insulin-like peptide 2 isoform X2 n=1 Tax=Hydra vulgaris TaxID=6087 RepID=A0ABM4CC70_HYDVU
MNFNNFTLMLFVWMCLTFDFYNLLDSKSADDYDNAKILEDLKNEESFTSRINEILKAYYNRWKTENALEYKTNFDVGEYEDDTVNKKENKVIQRELRVCTQAFLQSLLKHLCVFSNPVAKLIKKDTPITKKDFTLPNDVASNFLNKRDNTWFQHQYPDVYPTDINVHDECCYNKGCVVDEIMEYCN